MSSSKSFFDVSDEFIGQRVDVYLAQVFKEKSRSNIQKLLEGGNVCVNGEVVNKRYKVKSKDRVEVTLLDAVKVGFTSQDIPLEVVYEDNDILVVNKEKGMVVHPAPGHPQDTLVNALLFHCGDSLSGINGQIRPGIVHRIDKDTSGLLIVAKHDLAHVELAKQIKDHSFLREYEAVVNGRIKVDEFTIDEPIGRSRKDRKKMCVTYENSRNALTHVSVIRRYENFTHIRCRLETGRTHQIRVHLAYCGFPLAGDQVYGYKNKQKGLSGQCLHAKTIGFNHPITGKALYFTSSLPQYFTDFLSTLK